ncbi:universal stress protein [Paraburkholderia sp. CNPSo 3157]|uniref:Universal stress protein n=1 Tax=Paraburkholderia franconis TaxID=2654983 RepID=A0A7X1NAT7_9BURK|nr:universal stress protein [Paraburkholderia franconis]MPW18113.1 universal stress protein [Paraburkholderia franconis]
MYSHILVPIDGSQTAARAFDAARKLACETGAQLQPLYVVAAPLMAYDAPGSDHGILRDAFLHEGRTVMKEALALMDRDGVQGSPRIIEPEKAGDDIPHCILRAARDIRTDLVVMGTHGRSGASRFMLGSVAERFLRISSCPVLLISAHIDEKGNDDKEAAELARPLS